VPLDENFNVTDANRIEAAKPTIDKILADGGSVILDVALRKTKRQRRKIFVKTYRKNNFRTNSWKNQLIFA
jgi:phosphoglycerate kinase